jgi:hypothetical protein
MAAKECKERKANWIDLLALIRDFTGKIIFKSPGKVIRFSFLCGLCVPLRLNQFLDSGSFI